MLYITRENSCVRTIYSLFCSQFSLLHSPIVSYAMVSNILNDLMSHTVAHKSEYTLCTFEIILQQLSKQLD